LVTQPGSFDGFVRALGQPAERREIPDGPGAPPDMDMLVSTAAEYGLEILGPPGIPA
jgi:hypothetical protein